jgi:hypothetical protein
MTQKEGHGNSNSDFGKIQGLSMASTGDISDTFSFWAYFCFVKTAFLVIFVLNSELLAWQRAPL